MQAWRRSHHRWKRRRDRKLPSSRDSKCCTTTACIARCVLRLRPVYCTHKRSVNCTTVTFRIFFYGNALFNIVETILAYIFCVIFAHIPTFFARDVYVPLTVVFQRSTQPYGLQRVACLLLSASLVLFARQRRFPLTLEHKKRYPGVLFIASLRTKCAFPSLLIL